MSDNTDHIILNSHISLDLFKIMKTNKHPMIIIPLLLIKPYQTFKFLGNIEIEKYQKQSPTAAIINAGISESNTIKTDMQNTS